MFTFLYSLWHPYKLFWKIQRTVFYGRSCLQSQVFFSNLTDWLNESLQCCCHTCLLSRCSPCFIRLEILINFVRNKKNFFYWRSWLESQVSQKNLTDWHDESLQCCCHTITRSRLKLFWSLVMFTWLYSPWYTYKLCWKKKNCFFLKIFYFSMCLTSNKLYWIEDQLADVSTRFYTSASWCWRVETSATWP